MKDWRTHKGTCVPAGPCVFDRCGACPHYNVWNMRYSELQTAAEAITAQRLKSAHLDSNGSNEARAVGAMFRPGTTDGLDGVMKVYNWNGRFFLVDAGILVDPTLLRMLQPAVTSKSGVLGVLAHFNLATDGSSFDVTSIRLSSPGEAVCTSSLKRAGKEQSANDLSRKIGDPRIAYLPPASEFSLYGTTEGADAYGYFESCEIAVRFLVNIGGDGEAKVAIRKQCAAALSVGLEEVNALAQCFNKLRKLDWVLREAALAREKDPDPSSDISEDVPLFIAGLLGLTEACYNRCSQVLRDAVSTSTESGIAWNALRKPPCCHCVTRVQEDWSRFLRDNEGSEVATNVFALKEAAKPVLHAWEAIVSLEKLVLIWPHCAEDHLVEYLRPVLQRAASDADGFFVLFSLDLSHSTATGSMGTLSCMHVRPMCAVCGVHVVRHLCSLMPGADLRVEARGRLVKGLSGGTMVPVGYLVRRQFVPSLAYSPSLSSPRNYIAYDFFASPRDDVVSYPTGHPWVLSPYRARLFYNRVPESGLMNREYRAFHRHMHGRM